MRVRARPGLARLGLVKIESGARLAILAVGAGIFAASLVLASERPIPDCVDQGRVLSFNNQQALDWKADPRVPSGFKEQLYVEGDVVEILPRRTGHDHFTIRIGAGSQDLIEVVYSNAFGELPEPSVGTHVAACGEYIKSVMPNGGYPASPAGAIIHWVHKNPRLSPGRSGHDHGFVVVDGALYGWSSNARPGPDRGGIKD